MKALLSRLWKDDQGAVISMELVLIGTLLIFGLIPGLVALRNSINASLINEGNSLLVLNPYFSFAGFQTDAGPGGVNGPLAWTGGGNATPDLTYQLAASQPAGLGNLVIQVSPAP